MKSKIVLEVNGEAFEYDETSNVIYSVRETDSLRIVVYSDYSEPSVYFEDYEANIENFADEFGIGFRTLPSRYFSECFGHAVVRVKERKTYSIIFDVHAKKASSEQASKMIKYLAQQHHSLVSHCFARSSSPVGSEKDNYAEPNMIIFAAEQFVQTFETLKSDLFFTKRERLVPEKTSFWRIQGVNKVIDPADILSNLDSITPTNFESDLFINGRNYKLNNIDVTALIQTADVLENKILLGGLYSIQSKLREIKDEILDKVASKSSFEGYESFRHLLLQFTCNEIVARCEQVILISNELIKFLESKMGVSFQGEIQPIMTPYSRSSRVYQALYKDLHKWYELGRPTFDGVYFLIKLRSLSKIYEIYTLYHILETLVRSDWKIEDVVASNEFGSYLPSEVALQKANIRIKLFYEMQIKPFSNSTGDSDLVDVCHTGRGEYSYWKPDFVLRLEVNQRIYYFILDAKYSNESNVEKIHIPSLVDKYYWGTSTYIKSANIFSNSPITSILVIYPLIQNSKVINYTWNSFSNQNRKYCRYGPDNNSSFPLPLIGGVALSVDGVDKFDEIISRVLEQTISCSAS